MSRVAARLARALGFTPTQDQVASALLGVPPAQARAELYREAAAALAATATRHDVATRAEFAPSDVRRLFYDLAEQPPSRVACAAQAKTEPEPEPDASRRRVEHSPPPPVAVRASSVPGAGAGLFATSRVPRGALVALYGGVYVPPVPPVTPGADGVAVVIPAPAAADDDAALAYLIHLAAGGYLDGAAHAAAARAAADAGKCAGWGVAALANHPPRGVEPNVVAVDVEWAETPTNARGGERPTAERSRQSPDASRRLTRPARRDDETASRGGVLSSRTSQNVERLAREVLNPVKRNGPWYIDGATGAAVAVAPTVPTRGVALVASKTLEPGTEVFFDYQLSAKPLPAWYAPVPAEVMWRIVDGA